MGRIGRSFQLVGQSWRILLQDKELLVLPVMSGVLFAAIAASFFFAFDVRTALDADDTTSLALPAFLFYVVAYAIGFFFQAAIVAGATERLRGGDPTIRSALGAAARRLGPILMWAVVAATVGMILRSIQERAGVVGKIVVGIIGAGWSLATFFVVPVLVLEDKSIGDTVKRSLSLFRQTWGETLAGGVTIGLAAVCAWVTLIAGVGLLAWAGLGMVAATFGIAGVIVLATVFPALDGVFVASLYAYANAGSGPVSPGVDAFARTFSPQNDGPPSIRG
jgi:hypothetical protein